MLQVVLDAAALDAAIRDALKLANRDSVETLKARVRQAERVVFHRSADVLRASHDISSGS
jgi:hypothetical protein